MGLEKIATDYFFVFSLCSIFFYPNYLVLSFSKHVVLIPTIRIVKLRFDFEP